MLFRSVCGLERGAGVHELGKVCMDDAVALLDGIVAREDVLGVVVAKWQVKGVKYERLLKNTPLTHNLCLVGLVDALLCWSVV